MLCPHPGSTLETPTEQSSTKTELPASCLPSPKLRLLPFFDSTIWAWAGNSLACPNLPNRPPKTCLNTSLLAQNCSPFGNTDYLSFQGWVDFEVSMNGGPYYWKGMFYVGKFTKPDGNEKCVYKIFLNRDSINKSRPCVV